MILPDVNVLVHCVREEMPDHQRYRRWLADVAAADEALGVCDQVLSGVIRVTTNPRIFEDPLEPIQAIEFAERVRQVPRAEVVAPGPRHWALFTGLCRAVSARGNLVPDAWFAALAFEHDGVWVTNDRDFARFPGLKWRRPFDDTVTLNPETFHG